jgi:hypothetical protein
MKTEKETLDEITYSIGQKWINTENGVEFYITDICDTLVSTEDGKRKLSSIEHMNKILWRHLIKEGYYKRV